jgi:sugar phosphate isomerase/epimerase
MKQLRIGIRQSATGLALRPALVEIERLGAGGVQIDVAGDLAPGRLSGTGRREIRQLLRSHQLELTALGCPLRHGLDESENLDGRIDYVRQVLTLSVDLGSRTVIVRAGRIPNETEHDVVTTLIDALTDLASHGDRIGATLALASGREAGSALAAFLNRFNTAALAANLDPGQFLMSGLDPVEGAQALASWLVHCWATDARRGTRERAGQQMALGEGDLDWLQFLAVLEQINYRGGLVIGRDQAAPLAELAAGIAFLGRLGVGI